MNMGMSVNLPLKSVRRAIATISASALLFAGEARAGFFTSAEQDQVTELNKLQKPIAELLDQLRPADIPNAIGVYSKTQVLRGGKEDSDVVRNYLSVYITPCQQKLQEVAAKLKLEGEAQTKVESLPLLMKGHMLELAQAIDSGKADAQAREVEEVQETLADFLKLASSKYSVEPYTPPRPLTDAELFGPLGCEFWGKERVPGSNQCQAK